MCDWRRSPLSFPVPWGPDRGPKPGFCLGLCHLLAAGPCQEVAIRGHGHWGPLAELDTPVCRVSLPLGLPAVPVQPLPAAGGQSCPRGRAGHGDMPCVVSAAAPPLSPCKPVRPVRQEWCPASLQGGSCVTRRAGDRQDVPGSSTGSSSFQPGITQSSSCGTTRGHGPPDR